MKGNCGRPPVWMAVLAVCPSLANEGEPQCLQDLFDLSRLQNRNVAHCLGNLDRLNPDELGFESGLAILQKQSENLTEVRLELVQGGAL